MASLDDLLKLDGVVAAGEFTTDGHVVEWEAKVDEGPNDLPVFLDRLISTLMAETTAKFCADVTAMLDRRAGAFVRLSAMRWLPQRFWAFSGGDWTVAVGGNKGVFAQTAKADLNQLYEALAGG